MLSVSSLMAQDKEKNPCILLEQLVTDKIVLGASAGYSIDGQVVWQSAAGLADTKKRQKFELNTIVRLASIAKPMTAVAIMQLVEQDLIDLDAPIQSYIPDFPEQDGTQITTRHLLSHTSGIDGYANGAEAQNQINYPTLSAAVDVFKDRDLLFEPGTQYHYTTYGYVVLGRIIEQTSGLTYKTYMQQNIWDKAKMVDTGIEKFGVVMDRKTSLYHRSKKGKIKAGKENDLSNRIPGGGFYTTLADLLNFGQAMLDHTLIEETTFDRMRQHHSLEKESNGYGFGWFLYNPKPNEGALIGHSGEQTGASSQIFIVPRAKTVVAILSNTSGSSRDVSTVAGQLLGLAVE